MTPYQRFQLATFGDVLKEAPGDDVLENGESERVEFEQWEQLNHDLELINFDND